jgi:hypothetical protein
MLSKVGQRRRCVLRAIKALIPPNQEHTLCHSSPTLPESIVRRNRGHTVCLLADRRFKYNNVIKSGFGSCSRRQYRSLVTTFPFPELNFVLPQPPLLITLANFRIVDTVNVRIYVCFVCSLDEIYTPFI